MRIRFYYLLLAIIPFAAATFPSLTAYAQGVGAASVISPPTTSLTIPVFSPAKTLYVFDLEKYLELKPTNKVWQYDVINFVVALQGMLNRDEPTLYIFYVRDGLSSHKINVDRYWLEKLRGAYGFLADHDLVYIKTVEELIQTFRSAFSGVVLWDPFVPATGNVALTIAGRDGLLPIRHDTSPESLYTQLVTNGPQIPAGERLTGKFTPNVTMIPDINLQTTRTAKTDAYLWAKILYLDGGNCSPTHMAFFLDPFDWDPSTPGFQYPNLEECSIVNHDFYIGERAFFFDLDPWWDESATDVPPSTFNIGFDYKYFKDIMMSANRNTIEGDRMIRVGGFIPWWIKYTANAGGQHSAEETVEEFVSAISAYNGVIDADGSPFASIANASVYRHVPLKKRYFQNPIPPKRPLENKNYLLFVIGEFRSSALLYQTIPTLWTDAYRGELPLAWAISPLLSERVPHIFDYLYTTKTANDFFISGTPGAGVCFPNRYIPPRGHSELKNGIYFWEKLSKSLYKKFDLRTTVAADLDRLEISATAYTDTLQKPFRNFSPQGVGTLKPFNQPLYDSVVPFIMETANFPQKIPPMEQVFQTIAENSMTGVPVFHLYRFNLANPTTLYYLYQSLKDRTSGFQYELVDPFTFFYLLRQYRSGGDPSANSYIPLYLSHTIPTEVKNGDNISVEVTLRNDGWDTWNPPGTPTNRRYRLTYSWIEEGGTTAYTKPEAAYFMEPVRPGETTILPFMLKVPAYKDDRSPPLFRLILNFEQENVRASFLQEEIQVVVK